MVKKGAIWKFSAAFLFGIGVGLKSFIPGTFIGVLFLIMLVMCLVYAAQNNLDKFFTYLPYVVYTEVFVRTYARSFVPYLSVQYLYLFSFAIMLINHTKNKQAHSKVYYFLVMYGIIEIINGFFPARPDQFRSTILNSYSAILAVVWASYNVLSPALINRVMANIKIAAVFLAGIISVAEFRGDIQFGNFSNSEASNGLAPVQISGYLGVASAILFTGFMGTHVKKGRILNFILFVIVTVVMVLTFSRGGLYFIGIVAMLYMLFNRQSMGSYFKYLMLLPVILIGFNFIVSETGGAILKRYDEKGSSNRDVLAEIGYQLFLENPVLGVGTSNFGYAIVQNRLFKQESTAHNEFIRAIAEHGIFGLVAYWGFFIFMFLSIFRRKEPSRQYSVYFLVLFCLIVVHNGLKISIQQLLLILAVGNPGQVQAIRKRITHAIRRPQALQQSA